MKKPVFGRKFPTAKPGPGRKAADSIHELAVQIGGKTLPVGAYTMFLVPTPKQWTLIISKSTDLTGKYDEQQDLVRVPMESGELPMSEPQFSASFAHVGPNQCSFRLEMAKWAIGSHFRRSEVVRMPRIGLSIARFAAAVNPRKPGLLPSWPFCGFPEEAVPPNP